MNNNEKKKSTTKKKNNKIRDYELETYFKKSNVNKNNQNKKNNKKKYKYNNGNTVKVTKVLISDDVIVKEVKDKKTIKEEVLVKKNEKTKKVKETKKDVKDKKILIDDNSDLEKELERQNKETKDLLTTNPSLEKTIKIINSDLRKERVKGYLKESLIFTLIILVINIIIYFFTDEISFLRLFDIEYLNIIVTIIPFVILLFIGTFLINFLISELFRFVRKKRIISNLLNKFKKKKVDKVNKNNKGNNKRRSGGDSYRNQGINQGKHHENIKVKKWRWLFL